MRLSTYSLIVAILITSAGPAHALGQAAEEPEERSTRDGVFTQGQVKAGDEVFQAVCLECHDTFEFVESGYLDSWAGEPLFELYDYVSTMMPEDNPGSLRERQYTAVFAYIFSLNGLPAGEDRLRGDEEVLKKIIIELPEPGVSKLDARPASKRNRR